jgi:hypothetical protein
VRIDALDLSAFDPENQVQTRGGRHVKPDGTTIASASASGPFLVTTGTSTYGHLYVVENPALTASRPATTLPAIGSGSVQVVEADVEEPTALWIEPSDPAQLFGLGVAGAWLRIGNADYRILEQTDDRRRVLLEGASATVYGGETFQGVYKLDAVTLRNGVTLVIDDLAEIGVTDVDGTSTLTLNGN